MRWWILALLWTGLGSAFPAAAAPPNILFVVTDDMRKSDLAEMPLLKQTVTDRGIAFENAFVNVPLCCPSRATILRGQYSHNTEVRTNTAPGGGYSRFRPLERSTIATALTAAGYRTGLFGKYLNEYPGRNVSLFEAPIPAGWDTWRVPLGGTPYNGYNYTMLRYYPEYDFTLGYLYGKGAENYITDVLVAETRAFVEGAVADGVPFFAMLSTYAPHAPAVPAPRHGRLFPDLLMPRGPAFGELDVSDKPRYVSRIRPLRRGALRQIEGRNRQRVRSLQAVDEGVASLIARLDELGALDDTYVVFTSDNGFLLGEHRLKAGKQAPYDEATNVPLVVRGPGVPAGATSEELVLNTDYAPTFAAIGGATFGHTVDGRPLLPLFADPEGAHAWRQSVRIDLWPGRGRAELGTRPASYQGLRTRSHLYVEYKTGERELYDLVADPSQLENLAAEADPELLRALSGRVADLGACAGVRCRALEDLPVPTAFAEEPPKKDP
jgi:arylsulfatase A-like enzyme